MFASRIATSGFRAIHRDGYARGREAILCAITPHTTITAGAETPATPQAMASELNAGMSGSRLAVFFPAMHLLAAELRRDIAPSFPKRQNI